MVRLMLVLAPVACILSGISVSTILTTYMKVNNLFSLIIIFSLLRELYNLALCMYCRPMMSEKIMTSKYCTQLVKAGNNFPKFSLLQFLVNSFQL